MAFPFEVCSICFEKHGKNEAKVESLLKSNCLERPNRHTSVSVRVRRVDGVLEPQVRPMPRVYFTGHFVNCDPNRCRGEGCTFPHCFKEKAAWNAQKFGLEEGAADSHPQSTQAGATVAADQPSRTWCNHSLPDTSLCLLNFYLCYIHMRISLSVYTGSSTSEVALQKVSVLVWHSI